MNAIDWAAISAAILGGGAVVKLYETFRAGRASVRQELQARVAHLEATVDRLYGEVGALRERSAACEARCEALLEDLRAAQQGAKP